MSVIVLEIPDDRPVIHFKIDGHIDLTLGLIGDKLVEISRSDDNVQTAQGRCKPWIPGVELSAAWRQAGGILRERRRRELAAQPKPAAPPLPFPVRMRQQRRTQPKPHAQASVRGSQHSFAFTAR